MTVKKKATPPKKEGSYKDPVDWKKYDALVSQGVDAEDALKAAKE